MGRSMRSTGRRWKKTGFIIFPTSGRLLAVIRRFTALDLPDEVYRPGGGTLPEGYIQLCWERRIPAAFQSC